MIVDFGFAEDFPEPEPEPEIHDGELWLYEEGDTECHYPGNCIMNGEHFNYECLTPQMLDEYSARFYEEEHVPLIKRIAMSTVLTVKQLLGKL